MRQRPEKVFLDSLPPGSTKGWDCTKLELQERQATTSADGYSQRFSLSAPSLPTLVFSAKPKAQGAVSACELSKIIWSIILNSFSTKLPDQKKYLLICNIIISLIWNDALQFVHLLRRRRRPTLELQMIGRPSCRYCFLKIILQKFEFWNPMWVDLEFDEKHVYPQMQNFGQCDNFLWIA